LKSGVAVLTKILPALCAATLLGAGTGSTVDADPRAMMIQARSMQRDGGGNNPQGAVALYRKVIAQVPKSSQAYLRLSEALMESGNVQGALDPAIKATELDTRSGEAWAHLGLLYYIQTQSHESLRPAAVAALRKAVRLLPSDAELWTRLAEILDTLRDDPGALQAWLSVGRLRPAATYRGRVLSDFAWERALDLAVQLKSYEARREAVLALCDRSNPDQKYLKALEDLARDQVDLGFLGHAEESFELLGQFLPQEPAIWENIAIIQLRTGRFEAALEALTKAESMRKSARTSFNMGLCLMKLGSFPEAEARWKALLPTLGISEEDAALAPGVKELYATCVLLSGRPKEMLALSAPWPESASLASLAGLRAQAFIQVQDWQQARVTLKEGMARFPDQEVFQRAAEIPPKIFEEGRFFKSESRRALVQLDLEAMAELWAQFRSWNRCLEAVLEARKAAPVRDVELLLLQANALENLGQSDQAIKVLREGQKLKPDHPVLQNNLGFSLLEHGGNLDEAARLIKAALAQDPNNSATMDSMGWVLAKQGHYDEAEPVLRKAAELNPFNPEVHQHLGEVLRRLGRLQDAVDELVRALAFAVPPQDRKALEDQVQDLRTRLAKTQAAEAVTENHDEEPAEADDGADDATVEEGSN
jgi:tetratricopeptide (TPR) repeat protein